MGGSAGPFAWGQLYAHLIACTGQSPVMLRRDWDMVMVGHMTDYWRNHPPVHILVAGYMGYKPTQEVTDAPDLASNLVAMAADLASELPEHLRSALDVFPNPQCPTR